MDFKKFKNKDVFRNSVEDIFKDLLFETRKLKNINKDIVIKGFHKYFLDYLRENYLLYNGRIGRRHYWMFLLYMLVIGLVLETLVPLLYCIYFLFMLIPFFTITIRRLHDLNLSGWWSAVCVLSGIGMVVLALEGDVKTNNFG